MLMAHGIDTNCMNCTGFFSTRRWHEISKIYDGIDRHCVRTYLKYASSLFREWLGKKIAYKRENPPITLINSKNGQYKLCIYKYWSFQPADKMHLNAVAFCFMWQIAHVCASYFFSAMILFEHTKVNHVHLDCLHFSSLLRIYYVCA